MIEVKKTGAMREIEHRFGEPIDTLLRKKYVDEQQTFNSIGRDLKVKSDTIARWFRNLGIPKRSSNRGGPRTTPRS